MNADRREQIRRSLASLAASYRATMDLMEQTLSLLCEELSLDPWTYFSTRALAPDVGPGRTRLAVDRDRLTVTFQGKTCFLGNSLPFRLLSRLARRPNAYVPYEDLLSDVWHAVRSDDAVRSVVKTLRRRLRRDGMGALADAIDGTIAGHYALKLGP